MTYVGTLVAIVLAAVAAFFYTAQEMRGGTVGWANDACAMAYSLCLHPQWPAVAALTLIGMAVIGTALAATGCQHQAPQSALASCAIPHDEVLPGNVTPGHADLSGGTREVAERLIPAGQIGG